MRIRDVSSDGCSSDLFYITFRTRAPGVNIPGHLLERFPEEMTIVIQNRYWDLRVSEDRFEVGLSFNQVPAKLSIPFAALTYFVERWDEHRGGKECVVRCRSWSVL